MNLQRNCNNGGETSFRKVASSCSLGLLTIVLLSLSVAPSAVSAMERVPVFVSIVPQKFFVEQIGRERVDVRVMVQPGASPATYEPKPRQMADLSKARIYFAIGVPFEAVWLKKIAAAGPEMRVVHTDHGIEKLAMKAHHHHEDPAEAHHEGEHHEAEHDHEKAEHHGEAAHDESHQEHAGLDPHIWLSPPLVKVQARNILAALRDVDAKHRGFYESNFREFASRVDQLDADLKNIFSGKTGLQFMTFHPAWGYFARDYGLQQVPIEVEGKEPKPAQLQALVEHARKKNIRIIFVQPQFSSGSAEVIAGEIGGRVAFADPLAEDWIANLREVAGKFKAVLK